MKIKTLRDYNKMVADLNQSRDNVSNLQREKDFKVNKLEREYQLKIDKALERTNQLEELVKSVKKLIGGNKDLPF